MSEEKPLSPAAQKVITRIRALRVLSERTYFRTDTEQFQLLMTLSDEDLLAASVVLSNLRKGASNGNPR